LDTIGVQLDRFGRVGPGYDLVRLTLASLVVVVHSFSVDYGGRVSMNRAWLLGELVVPMFFVVSGFFIAASAEHHRPAHFFWNRFLRIYPALITSVVLVVFVLGPLVTTLTLRGYFAALHLRPFELLFSGRATLTLPGVFLNNPDTAKVNVPLWTVPWEIGCYAVMGLLAAAGVIRSKRLRLAVGLAIIFIPSIVYVGVHGAMVLPRYHAAAAALIDPQQAFLTGTLPVPHGPVAGKVYWVLEFFGGWNFRPVPYFAAGAVAYFLRYRIPYSPLLAFAAALVLVTASLAVPYAGNGPILHLLLCVPTAYLVAWCGVTPLRLPAFLKRGDYSYGVYLYAYPIQQVAYLTRLDHGVWWLNSIVSLVLVMPLAMVSWHWIEHPILRRRSSAALRFDAGKTRAVRASPARRLASPTAHGRHGEAIRDPSPARASASPALPRSTGA
jgi:peptidoglycan/LPS O-acetylase OafA/YrhL